MSRMISRLSRIEGQLKPAGKGHQVFWTEDQETYYKGTKTGPGQRIDYRDGIVEALPAPQDSYSRDDLEALKQEGWELIVIQYVDYASMPESQ